jgi:hypothetical protein
MLKQRIFALIRLLLRMLAGAVIGIAVVAVFTSLDYLGQADKKLWWVDSRDSILTALTLGVLIGATIGVVWALCSKGRNEDRKTLSTQTLEGKSSFPPSRPLL